MKSILGLPLSAVFIWQCGFLFLASYLVFNPPLANPQSTAIALGGGLLLALFSPFLQNKTPRLGFGVWAFMTYALLSFTWSCQPGVSLVAAGFLFLAVLLFLSQAGWEGKAQEVVEYFGLLLALIAVAMALEQRFFGLPALHQTLPDLSRQEQEMVKAAIHNQRAFGPLVTPGALAALILFFLPQAFIRAKIASGFKRTLLYIACLFLIAGLWATQSVGALAALTLAVLTVLVLKRSFREVGLVLLLGLAGIFYLIAQRGVSSWHLAAYSMRLELWDKAWQLFLMKPWLGWGLGCFGEAYQNMGFDPNTGSRFAHDLPLQVLVELGIPGFLLLLFACFSILKRVKPQPRWESWGVGTGLLAVFLFSLVDLPFQMPELVFLFAAIAGRIELKTKTKDSPPSHQVVKNDKMMDGNKDFITSTLDNLLWQKNIGRLSGVEWILLTVFLATGFWPPFRPWNFALLAGTLWTFAGLSGKIHDQVSLWTVLGVLYFIVRAMTSPSASGCTGFLEMSGILLAFGTLFPSLQNKERFLKGFGLLGLVWGLKVWWETFHYHNGGLGGWIHFQFSDVKDWIIFPNPKQIGIFLIPLLFLPLLFHKPGEDFQFKFRNKVFRLKSTYWYWWTAALGALLTAIRLKSFGAFLGFFVGGLGLVKKKYLPAVLGISAILLVEILTLRSADPSPTKWGRFEIWDSAVKVFIMNPILGMGPGAFAGLYHLVKEPRAGGVSRYLMDARYAHNEALEVLAAFGLLGFIFILAWLIRLWPGKDQVWKKVSALGLGAASLTDFCFHTPLMALWGTAFLNLPGTKPNNQTALPKDSLGNQPSLSKGFLVLGIALGLFGPPSFTSSLVDQFGADLQANHLPQALRGIETAETLSPWDARLTETKMDFLEKLYLATGDDTWKNRADEAQERVIELESSDGSLRFEKAERLNRRLDARPSSDNLSAVEKAWDEADRALPTNAFVKFEKGVFYFNEGPGKTGKWDMNSLTNGALAFRYFQQAVQLEPNFAQAWYYSGFCRKGMGEDLVYLVDYHNAYDVYDKYKSAEGIDPMEKLLVALTPEQVDKLRYELGKK